MRTSFDKTQEDLLFRVNAQVAINLSCLDVYVNPILVKVMDILTINLTRIKDFDSSYFFRIFKMIL